MYNKNFSTPHVSILSTHLMIVAVILCTMYLIANIMAVKLINIRGITVFDAGTITFPIAYMLGDILTEIWGFRVARKVILLSFLCNIFLMLFTTLGIYLPYPDYTAETAEAYAHIFGYVPRIVLASLVAFLVGEIANAFVMDRMKKWTEGRHLWLRTISSSMLGYFLDTTIFVCIAFAGTVPLFDLFTMIVIQYIGKVLLEAIFATPFVYILVNYYNKLYAKERQMAEK